MPSGNWTGFVSSQRSDPIALTSMNMKKRATRTGRPLDLGGTRCIPPNRLVCCRCFGGNVLGQEIDCGHLTHENFSGLTRYGDKI